MYVDKDGDGNIVKLFSRPQREGHEYIEGAMLPLTDADKKMAGVEFNGVMCSATKEDMWGLSSVKDWVVSGNDVEFEFDNGNKLLLTKDNYALFEAVWVPFRAGFF